MRFSIRALLIFVTIVGGPLALYAHRINENHRQETIAKSLKRFPGMVRFYEADEIGNGTDFRRGSVVLALQQIVVKVTETKISNLSIETSGSMFWEFYQQSQIQKANKAASRAELRTEQSKDYLQLLENKIESLALACQSLWEILEERTDITSEQLHRKMEEVDLRDGKKDGKLSAAAKTCQSCGRKTSRRRPVCLYCGADNESKEPFGLR